MKKNILLLFLFTTLLATETLDVRILRVEFEEQNNSLTTGRGIFDSDPGDYKLDPKGARKSEAYWQSHMKFAKKYFENASGGKVSINAEVYPKKQDAYKLDKHMIEYNRTSRNKGEKLAEFDSARAADYARFVNDVLALAKNDEDNPLRPSIYGQRVILIAHAGANRLVDGGTMGTRGADTPGDFMDAYIDTTWGEFWKGFEVFEGDGTLEADTIRSAVVTSETASQDGLNWGIIGTIASQLGRELGLPYTFDVVKGYSRLGFFDGMDFAGYNAGNGFFPSLPSAWLRMHKEWGNVRTISPILNEKITVQICAASATDCGVVPQIVKIPINSNEYILLENRQRTRDGTVTVQMNSGQSITIPVDSLRAHFLDSATQKYTGVIESINEIDAAIPASGIAAWRVNNWYVQELLPFGAINAWNGDLVRDHWFGIALIESDGILGLGKEFRNAAGESVFYFGSGSDLIPHKKKGVITDSINPVGYANTASTFGGYSGIKIRAKVPEDGKEERTLNPLTGDSVTTWQSKIITVEIEWEGKYARPVLIDDLPSNVVVPTEEDFARSKAPDFSRIVADIDGDGYMDSIFVGNNRLHVVDSNGVPLPNFPVILSNGTPFTDFNSKPLAIDITGNDTLDILVPVNNGLIVAVNSKGKLLRDEFPLAAGTFKYFEPGTDKPDTLLLHISSDYKYLFAKHGKTISAFYLPLAKEYSSSPKEPERKDEIAEFFIFPNPVRQGKASMRFRILNNASEATLDIFDITGFRVFNHRTHNVNHGSNQMDIDLSKLGSDIYSARLTVKFASGKKKEKWVRIGVIR
ncbi:MAG: T9SS type A sorting domain-containing protein [Fibromonadaceae bacterium]|nr:T9SS type A sorting domain-containing protein [Fibromonadaceae bacterium]